MSPAPGPMLLLIEPRFSGHHGVYVRWIAHGAIQRGYRVRLATARAQAQHPLLLRLQSECGADLDVAFLPDIRDGEAGTDLLALARQDARFYALFRSYYRTAFPLEPPSFVFLSYVDYCLYSLAMWGSPFGRTPWGGIAMRPAFHLARTPGTRIKEQLFLRLLNNPTLASLFVMDETLHEHITQRHPARAVKCHYLPDPAEMNATMSKQAARATLGIAKDVLVILVYGAISLRKGIDLLLAALREPEGPARVHVLLAGQQDAESKAFMASAAAQPLAQAGRIHSFDAFLSADDEARVFAAADLLWMGYRGHLHASGVMVQAGQAGLPVIGCAEGMIGRTIQGKRLGIILPLQDAQQTARAIQAFINDEATMKRCGENGRIAFASHTPKNFADKLFE